MLIAFSLGCNKDDGSGCFTQVGDIISEERTVEADFNSIVINDNAVVYIKQGNEYKIEVRGGSKLMQSYITRFENSRLIIENKTICKWIRDQNTPFEVNVSVPHLDSIIFYGYGDIYGDGVIEVDDFVFMTRDGVGDVTMDLIGENLRLIMHTGATNVNLKGSFNYTYAYSTSYSILNLEELYVDSGFYVNGGTGNFIVNTKNYIKAQLNLTGNIYYNQEPFIYVETQLGSGEMIHY